MIRIIKWRKNIYFCTLYRYISNNEISTALNLLDSNIDIKPKDLKLKYIDLVKKHHPDVGGSEEKMKEITTAYKIIDGLSDSDKKFYKDNKARNQMSYTPSYQATPSQQKNTNNSYYDYDHNYKNNSHGQTAYNFSKSNAYSHGSNKFMYNRRPMPNYGFAQRNGMNLTMPRLARYFIIYTFCCLLWVYILRATGVIHSNDARLSKNMNSFIKKMDDNFVPLTIEEQRFLIQKRREEVRNELLKLNDLKDIDSFQNSNLVLEKSIISTNPQVYTNQFNTPNTGKYKLPVRNVKQYGYKTISPSLGSLFYFNNMPAGVFHFEPRQFNYIKGNTNGSSSPVNNKLQPLKVQPNAVENENAPTTYISAVKMTNSIN